MTQSEVNKLLKEAGLGFVKINTSSYPINRSKKYTNWEGKSFKGFRGGSIGPMTVTNAHLNHNKEVVQRINELTRDYSCQLAETDNGVIIKFQAGSGKDIVKEFKWNTFPTNSASMGFDPAYQTYWLVEVKK